MSSSQLHLIAALIVAVVLSGCSSPPKGPPVDTTLSQLNSSARAAYDRGNFKQAVSFYERALQRARQMDDGPEVARTGYNLAACYLAAGRPADARTVLKEALAEFGRYRMDSHAAIVLDIKAARAAGQENDAANLLPDAFSACKTDDQRFETWLLKGRIACEDGDKAALRESLDAADRLKSGDAAGRAELASLKACSLSAEEQPYQAAQSYDEAADAYKRAGRYREMARALARAGDAYSTAAIPRDAADRLYRSARSYASQGDTVEALRVLDRGMNAAEASGDESLKDQLRTLFEQIEGEVEQSKVGADE